MKTSGRTFMGGIILFLILMGLPLNAAIFEVKLRIRHSFPSEYEDASSVWLVQATAMARAQSGHLFVCNNKEKTIVKFDPSGKYLMKFGRPGQGPGDFLNIAKIMADGQRLIVYDSMKHEFSLFSLEGKFIHSIKLFKSYRDVVFDGKDRFYATVPPRGASRAQLVDVLDKSGKLLFSFGDPVRSFGDRRDTYQNEIKLAWGAQSLVVLFTNVALIRRYAADGRLLAERAFDESPKIQSESQQNIKRFQNIVPGQVGYRRLFDAIKSANESWYLLRNSKFGLEIIETGPDLKAQKSYFYRAPSSWEGVYMDFEIVSTANDTEFFLLRWMPESKVEIMIPVGKAGDNILGGLR